jgi:DNA-binding NarL/FixJ family response regulator
MPLRTIVGDADPLARRLIKTALQDAGVTVVAEARTCTERLELALDYRPDVVLVDCVDTARALHRHAPARPIAVLAHEEDEQLALAALEAGASGFLAIDLLSPGRSTGDIADALVTSSETVRSHVKSIMRKLGVHSRGTPARRPSGCARRRPRRSPRRPGRAAA